jgi:GT2 family glycosyltransferase
VTERTEEASASPRVLLVVPTLGRRLGYLAQSLESIRAQGVPVDIVMVVPAAALDARALGQRYGVHLIDDPGSLSGAVNAGFAAAREHHALGNWLGDDDLLTPGSLAAAVRVLDRDRRTAVAYGQCRYIDGDGRELWLNKSGHKASRLLPWGPDLVPQPGMLFRLADFSAVGGLDESLEFAMDLDLLLRLRRRGRLVYVPRPLSCFRWHQTSLTVSDRTRSLSESERVKHRYLPARLRRLAPVWDVPVRQATRFAARRVNRRAQRAGGLSA